MDLMISEVVHYRLAGKIQTEDKLDGLYGFVAIESLWIQTPKGKLAEANIKSAFC